MSFNGLRLGLIGPMPPPSGGMANQTRQLAELLGREGASVSLVATNAPYRPACLERVRWVRSIFRIVPYVHALWRCAGRVELFHVMANSGWSWHLFAAPAVWIGKLRGIPVLVNYRGGEAEAFLSRAHRWVLPTLRRVDMLAVPSDFLRNVFEQYGVTAHVLPNIVDLARFRPLEQKSPTAARASHIVIARNLEVIYDNATAIRAFAIVLRNLPNASMVVAGSGPERNALERLAQDLGVASRLTFAGTLDREEIADLYRTGHVAINPSRVDNMPNSILEALASGVPVVSTRVGGVPHMVQDGVTALLVPPGQPEAMAEAVMRVLNDRNLACLLRDNGLIEVQRYAWGSVGPKLLSAYNCALRRPSSDMLAA